MATIDNPHLLVIGGTGFIGRHLLKAAQTKGWKISIASLTIPHAKKRLNKVNYYKRMSAYEVFKKNIDIENSNIDNVLEEDNNNSDTLNLFE